MKKLIALGAILCIALLVGGVAYASSVPDTVDVTLTVGPIFTFSIGEAIVDMGSVAEGASGVIGCTMYCSTNQNNAWRIQVKSSTVDGIIPGNQIPLSNLKFNTYALADGGGTNSAGTFIAVDTALTGLDQLAYTAAAAEASDTDVRVGMVFVLDVPYSTSADTYTATVTATMTE